METQSFVYATYIKATPEQVWQGLTSPEFTRRYWDIEFVTDWKPGSPMTWEHHGVTITDPEQIVLEADPFTRLSYTWHTIAPELAAKFDWSDDLVATLNAETRSRATFEIEDLGALVKLTVVHEGFDPDSTMVTMVSEGWPKYTQRRRRTLIIDRVDRVEEDPRSVRRIAWQDFVPHV